MDINSINNFDNNNNIISENNYQNYESNNDISHPIIIPSTFSETTNKIIYNNNINNNSFINSNFNNLANIKTLDISGLTYNENNNNNININLFTKYQTTQINNAVELTAVSSEPSKTIPPSKSEYFDYNININSNLDITSGKLQRKYKVENEIVPVGMTEKVFFKKNKKCKNILNIKKEIKSKYNIIKIFSFLELKTKLQIIKYNKFFQKLFGLNIEHYKKVSEKYKINGNNGFGREYSKYNSLLFEGEYLNGKRNGKGKEYYEYGKLKFDGEYSNGKRNGKGKEYVFYGKLVVIFDGEYLNGKRHGEGKEYYDRYDEYNKVHLKFEGEYLNGEKWNGNGYDYKGNFIFKLNKGKGIVKEYDLLFPELIFEGEYLNGKKTEKEKNITILAN